MFTLLLATVLAASPNDPLPALQTAGSARKPVASAVERAGPAAARGPHELRRDVRAALQRTSSWIKGNPGRAAAELLPIFAALKCDTQMVQEERDRYAGIVRERLVKLEKTLARPPRSAATASPGAAGGGAPNADLGKELVALIQHVIAPDTWDVAGGNGVIIYYEPLQVLVVRQTDEVHGQVGGVFDQLRRN
jgi:hypothetical protein